MELVCSYWNRLYIVFLLQNFQYKNSAQLDRSYNICLMIWLNLAVKTNLKVADFLDTHFEVVQDIQQPYKKRNNEPLYINKNSNHPQTFRKQIPKAISKRISDISSSKEIYDQNINYYKDRTQWIR